MKRSLVDTYTDELEFLISLKKAVSILNNRIHDKLSWIAIEKLKTFHPTLRFEYAGAGAGGIDIKGYAGRRLKLIAEVKSTHTSETVGLRGPQVRAIQADLERLEAEPGSLIRYMIVVSEQTQKAVAAQIKPHVQFPRVKVIDAIGLVQIVIPDDAATTIRPVYNHFRLDHKMISRSRRIADVPPA